MHYLIQLLEVRCYALFTEEETGSGVTPLSAPLAPAPARVMKLEASSGIATSEVPKPEKEAELQSHFQTQEPGATSSSSSGLDAEVEPLQEESGSEAKAPSP
ncbi:putative N-Acetyltransferase 16 [Manis pentadactyla]|nr:putative N-Acetyltransferase 16 [Manis pentadactyla]